MTVSNFVENSRRYSQVKVPTTPVANNGIWGCRYSNVNLKAKIYFYVSSTTQRWPNKIIKIFLIEDFSICHRCRWHRWQTLSCEYLREFSKKFETVLMEYSWDGGKLIHEKNQKQKISWHCPFKSANQVLFLFGGKVERANWTISLPVSRRNLWKKIVNLVFTKLYRHCTLQSIIFMVKVENFIIFRSLLLKQLNLSLKCLPYAATQWTQA